jgi:transposase-like protein
VDLETPRDRAGTFTPQIVRKGQRRLDGGPVRSSV